MAFSRSSLDSLPTRPPTPPKGADEVDQGVADALEFLQNDSSIAQLQSNNSTQSRPLDTPPASSPLSSQERAGIRHGKIRSSTVKRVGFSPWTNYHRPPDYSQADLGLSPPKPLPPSRELKSFRSILKQSPRSSPPPALDLARCVTSPSAGHSFPSFEAMLEYMLSQLEYGDQKARVDAYVSLCGTLGACECLPNDADANALHGQMDGLICYIKRDCTLTPCEDATINNGLITQSLKLLSTLLFTPTLSRNFSDDTRIFVIERSIAVLRDPAMPKPIIRCHISMLAQQNFSSNVITHNRAERLLDTLQNIEERVKGNSIIGGRLSIYQRTLSQARSALRSKINGVLEHVFHGMLSSIGDIRKRAIDLGTQLGVNLGSRGQSHMALVTLFATGYDSDGNLDYGSFYVSRLRRMFHNRDCRKYVPQIWAVAILFFQNRGHRLPKWRHAKSWLRLIQDCLNCSDANVRFQAFFAWNRLVSVVHPDTSTSQEMVNMLAQPLSLQLQRTEAGKTPAQIKQFALSSYCNLLYYSFRPTASPEELDYFWNAYVKEQLSDLLGQNLEYAEKANQILAALFVEGGQIPWDAGRANYPDPLKPRELPRLSAKWVRKRLSVILPLLELSLEKDSQKTIALQDMPSNRTWMCLMAALGEAGNQEIKASLESQEAMAQIMNSLHRLWNKIFSSQNTESSRTQSSMALFSNMAYLAMHQIGSLNFTQKILVQKHAATFEVAPSPSRRSHRTAKQLQSPFQCIFRLLVSSRSLASCHESILHGLSKLVQLACASQNTRQAKLNLLQECMDDIVDLVPQDATLMTSVWPVIANEMTEPFRCAPNAQTGSQQHSRHDFQTAIDIFGSAIRSSEQSSSASQELYISLIEAARREASDGGVAMTVMEPLANVLNSSMTNLSDDRVLFYSSFILKHGTESHDQKPPELVDQREWQSLLQNQANQVSQPCEKVYYLTEASLQICHPLDRLGSKPAISNFLSSLATFIGSSSIPSKFVILQKTQARIASIVEDREDSYDNTEALLESVTELWRSINQALRSFPYHDNLLLTRFAPLVSAGFCSRHKCVVDIFVDTWNQTFGRIEKILYPEQVELALQKFKSRVDVDLHAFPCSIDGNISETPARLREPAKAFDQIESNENREAAKSVQPMSSPPRSGNGEKEIPTPAARRISSPTRPTPKARLQHDDSQIEFTVIESSPTDYDAMESQLLTEHQKEVRSQQQAGAAAMFPDIRSSPRSRIMPSSDLRKQMRGIALTEREGGIEEPATPSPSHAPIDDFLSSSPTPGSAIKQDLIMASEVLCSFAQNGALSYNISEHEELPSSTPEPLGYDDGTSGYRHAGSRYAQIERCSIENVGHPMEQVLVDASKTDEVEMTDADTEVNDSFQESSVPSLEPQKGKDDAHLQYSNMKTYDGADDDRFESESQKHWANHGDQETTQAQSKDVINANTVFSETQSKHGACGVESDAFVDAASVHVEQGSELTEEPEIFVDASQSPLVTATTNIDDKTHSLSDRDHMQTSRQDKDRDDSTTPSAIDESFVMDMEQPLLQVSTHNQQHVERTRMQPDRPQLSQTNHGNLTLETRKRKRGSQGSINVRRSMKKRESQPLQAIYASAHSSQDFDDIQDCITVLPLSQSPKKRSGRLPKAVMAEMGSEIRPSQPKRKASSELLREEENTNKFRSGEGGAGEADPDSGDNELEHDTTSDVSKPGSKRFSHVEIERSQHSPAMPPDRMDTDVDELRDAQGADDTFGEDVLVGATEDDVDAAGRTAGWEDAADAEASQQLVSEQAAAQAARRIAQPKSIIERLKGILADCRGVVFGSQDRLDLYDTLAEVHAAVKKRKDDDGEH